VEPAQAIGKLGFQRWYERQLLEAHAWLITCFLCLVAVAACLEAFLGRGPLFKLFTLALAIFAAGGIGVTALERYRAIMVLANRLAGRATCASCRAYAAFKLVGSDASSLTVRCRKCAHEWRID
jgi:hypothetical protein